MQARLDIDTAEFSRVARQLAQSSKWRGKNYVAQLALDVTSQAFERTPPVGPGDQRIQNQRTRINRYLNQLIGNRTRRPSKSGKGGRIAMSKRLARKHLIIQARRAARGLSGLYGDAMRTQVGRFTARAQQSVGFLKSLFIPVIRGLNKLSGLAFRYPRSKYNRISVWPNSDGSGVFEIKNPADAINEVLIELKARIRDTEAGKVRGMLDRAWHEAVVWKTAKMKRELQRLAGEIVGSSSSGSVSATSGILSQQRRSMATGHGRAQYGRR